MDYDAFYTQKARLFVFLKNHLENSLNSSLILFFFKGKQNKK